MRVVPLVPPVLATAFLAAIAALACASPAPPPADLPARAVVVPVNFDVGTPAQLEPGLETTDELLQLYLRHRGVEVERAPLGRVRRLWGEAVPDGVPPLDDPAYAAGMGRLLAALAPGCGDCVLVVPGLSYRLADLAGTMARWDGVSERITWENLDPELVLQLDGLERAVSIWMRVYSVDGQLLHEGYGGVELPWKIAGRDTGALFSNYKYHWERVERDDLFRDHGRVAKGIKVALDPFVPGS